MKNTMPVSSPAHSPISTLEDLSRHQEQVVPLTPSRRRKLQLAFKNRYGSIAEFLQDWQKRLEERPPSMEEITEMLYSTTYEVFPYRLANGACWLLLGAPYRDNSHKKLAPDLKKALAARFEKRFKFEGKTSWTQFFVVWKIAVPQYKPPRRQTLQIFFNNTDRHTCEHWLADGLCRLLLGQTYEDLLQRYERTEFLLEPLEPMEEISDLADSNDVWNFD